MQKMTFPRLKIQNFPRKAHSRTPPPFVQGLAATVKFQNGFAPRVPFLARVPPPCSLHFPRMFPLGKEIIMPLRQLRFFSLSQTIDNQEETDGGSATLAPAFPVPIVWIVSGRTSVWSLFCDTENVHTLRIKFCNKFFVIFRGDSTKQVLVKILCMAVSSSTVLCVHIILSNLFILEEILSCSAFSHFPFQRLSGGRQFVFTDGDNCEMKRILKEHIHYVPNR